MPGEILDDVSIQLLGAGRKAIATRGVAGVAVRTLAQDIGKSTFVVFSRFGSRSLLLLAAADSARHLDAQFDADFFAGVAGLPLTASALSDIVCSYLLQRGGSEPGRVWLECLSSGAAIEGLPALLTRWYMERNGRWQAFLSDHALRVGPIAYWIDLLVMEEFYAAALGNDPRYELLLREQLRVLFGAGERHAAEVTDWLNLALEPCQVPYDMSEVATLKARLLDAAADQIIEEGVGSVTNSGPSRRAGTSTSMIAYHFGSVENFIDQAVLHTLLRNVPFFLDRTAGPAPDRLADPDAWIELTASTTRPAPAGAPRADNGFYVNYARVIGQACMRARQKPDIIKRLLLLRTLEGEGIYRARDIVWPTSFAISRTTSANFAIWIKGFALVNDALARNRAPVPIRSELITAADLLVRI